MLEIDRLIRSKRRSLSIEIDLNGHLVVRAPFWLPQRNIADFLRLKTSWVLKKKRSMQERLKNVLPRTYQEGERFFFSGNLYPLALSCDSNKALYFDGARFVLSGLDRSQGRKLFEEWYREKAKDVIPPKVRETSMKLGVSPVRIRISKSRSRWGACGSKGSLHFSLRLMMVPPEVLDYVIVHEVCHLKEPNHSSRFWALVHRFMPHTQRCRKWLRDYGHSLIY